MTILAKLLVCWHTFAAASQVCGSKMVPNNTFVVGALGLLGVASVVPTNDPILDTILWLIKLLGAVAGGLLIWYTKRILGKLENALEFFEKAPETVQKSPEGFWARFRLMERDVREIRAKQHQEER